MHGAGRGGWGRWIRRAGISNVASGPHSFLASGDRRADYCPLDGRRGFQGSGEVGRNLALLQTPLSALKQAVATQTVQ